MQPSNKSHFVSSQGYNSGPNNSMSDEPPSAELLKLLADKREEIEEITQFSSASDELLDYLQNIADNLNKLSAGAREVSSVAKNWTDAFIIMGLTNKDNKKQNELLRFAKKQ